MAANTKHSYLNNFTRNSIPPDTRYRYEIAKPQHREGIIRVFTEAFCGSEPMTHYLQIDPEKFNTFSSKVTDNAINDQLCIVALDQDKVIACALVEDMAAMHEVPTDFDPKFQYIINLLEQLGGDFFKNKQFKKNTIAHLFITAVANDYRHQGLSTQVNFHVMDLAAKHGFKFIYTELTNVYNEMGVLHHLKNNRKRLIGTCIYKDFEMNGMKPFANLEGLAHGYLIEISEGAKLTYAVNDQIFNEVF